MGAAILEYSAKPPYSLYSELPHNGVSEKRRGDAGGVEEGSRGDRAFWAYPAWVSATHTPEKEGLHRLKGTSEKRKTSEANSDNKRSSVYLVARDN
jgi:hypothetical protein